MSEVRTVYQEEIIDNVFNHLNDNGLEIYKKDVREVFKATFKEIREALNTNGKVQINDFATITLYMGKPSVVRHPISGELVPKGVSRKRVKFSPIGEMREELKVK